MTGTTAASVQGYAGLASSAAGIGASVLGSVRQFSAAKRGLEATAEQVGAILREGRVVADAARSRAVSALREAGSLTALTEARIRYLERQGQRMESSVIAAAAASGIDFVGSPLLAAGDAALEAQRAIANERLQAEFGVERLLFEAEQELIRAEGAQIASERQAEGVKTTGIAQARQTRSRGFSGLTAASSQLTSVLSSKSTRSLFKDKE